MMSGGHWVALQCVAWGRMIVEFSQRDSLGGAFYKTFNGRHPCSLCIKVSEGSQQEQRQAATLSILKTDKAPELFWEDRGISLPSSSLAMGPPPFMPEFPRDFIDSPASPPPRS